MKRNLRRYAKVVAGVRARDLACRVCSRWVGDYGHTHHIVYRSLGGDDSLDNCILLCHMCHAAEHSKLIRISGTANALTVEKLR